MPIIVGLPKRSFDSVWDGNKTFYVLEDRGNKYEPVLNHVISFRELNDKTNSLTGREVNASIGAMDHLDPYYKVISLKVYQRLDFKKNPVEKRKI